MTFENKIIVITGGSSGIGKALVLEALALGAKVATCARNEVKLYETFKDYVTKNLFLYKADVSQKADVEAFVKAVIYQFGQIDILINNAGMSMRALFEYTQLDVIESLMAVNFMGTVYATKYCLPYILKNQGTIVGISSIAGYRGLPARSAYSSSKFAMQGFLESLRTELLHKNVNVMWVSPGFTASNIRQVALNSKGESQAETPLDESNLMTAEDCAKRILKSILLKKRAVVMTRQGLMTVWLNKLFPRWADKLVYNHFLNEADSPLKTY